jgi:hypothetical protein
MLFGTPNPDDFFGLEGRDALAGGGGNDVFRSPGTDGADDYRRAR